MKYLHNKLKHLLILSLFVCVESISFAQPSNILATYAKSTNSKVTKLNFLRTGKISLIDTSLNEAKDFKLLSFSTEFINAGRVVRNYSKKGKLTFRARKSCLKYATDKNVYIKSIRAIDLCTKDTITLNSILISFSGKSTSNSSLTFKSTLFSELEVRTLNLEYLLKLTEIPIIGEQLELISYTIICNYTKELKATTKELPQELKDLIRNQTIRPPMQILFKDILVKDASGILFEIPVRFFTLTSL